MAALANTNTELIRGKTRISEGFHQGSVHVPAMTLGKEIVLDLNHLKIANHRLTLLSLGSKLTLTT